MSVQGSFTFGFLPSAFGPPFSGSWMGHALGAFNNRPAQALLSTQSSVK
jgi:hypothetical protein